MKKEPAAWREGTVCVTWAGAGERCTENLGRMVNIFAALQSPVCIPGIWGIFLITF